MRPALLLSAPSALVSPEANVKRAGRAGALDALVAVMRSYPTKDDLLHCACEVMSKLCFNGSRHTRAFTIIHCLCQRRIRSWPGVLAQLRCWSTPCRFTLV